MANALRVLLISGEYPPMQGGVSDFTHLVGQDLAALGCEVHVLTSTRAAQRSGSPVVCHPIVPSWGWRTLYGTLRALLAELGPDVINIQYQTAAYGLHPAINALPTLVHSVPSVVTYHDLLTPYLFPKAGPVRWWANLALARTSHAVIVTNREDELQLQKYRWIRLLERIPIGSNVPCVPPDDYDRDVWRAGHNIPKDTLLMCYFGFLNASKGGEELIAALEHLCREGYDARLLMIGGQVGASDPTNQAYLRIVQRSIHAKRLDERVIWTGYMPPQEVSAAFLSADVCVLPYRDGASFRRGSFMAALTHGMPIVTTEPRVNLPELSHEENVFLVPPRAPDALAQGVMRLANDVALRRRLGEGARLLSREFDWRHIAERTLEVYHAVIAR